MARRGGRKKYPQEKLYLCKTQLCNKWVQLGKCPYNNYCMFAHGQHEIVKPGEYMSSCPSKLPKPPPLLPQKFPQKVCPSTRRTSRNSSNESDDYNLYWKTIHSLIIN